MEFSTLKLARYQGGFEGRFLQLLAKQAALEELEKQAGISTFMGKVPGMIRGGIGGAASRVGQAGGAVMGGLRGFGQNIAKGYNQGVRQGYRAVAGRNMPRVKPVAPVEPAAPAVTGHTGGPNPPAEPAGSVAQQMKMPGGSMGDVPPAGSNPSMVDPSQYGGVGNMQAPNWMKTMLDKVQQHPTLAGVGAGMVGQNLYDANTNRMRRNELASSIGNMGFGDRLSSAMGLMFNPQGMGQSMANRVFQPSLMSAL